MVSKLLTMYVPLLLIPHEKADDFLAISVAPEARSGREVHGAGLAYKLKRAFNPSRSDAGFRPRRFSRSGLTSSSCPLLISVRKPTTL